MLAFAGLSPMEWIVIVVVGVLLFGRKLPEAALRRRWRNWGGEPPYESGSRVPRRPNPRADAGSIALEPPIVPDGA